MPPHQTIEVGTMLSPATRASVPMPWRRWNGKGPKATRFPACSCCRICRRIADGYRFVAPVSKALEHRPDGMVLAARTRHDSRGEGCQHQQPQGVHPGEHLVVERDPQSPAPRLHAARRSPLPAGIRHGTAGHGPAPCRTEFLQHDGPAAGGGRLVDDDVNDPGASVNRSILVRIPKDYGAADLRVILPLLTRPPDGLVHAQRLAWGLSDTGEPRVVASRCSAWPRQGQAATGGHQDGTTTLQHCHEGSQRR